MDEWRNILQAPREPGKEILGVVFIKDHMVKEPFITFWSPTLKRFYCNPTHYIPLPKLKGYS